MEHVVAFNNELSGLYDSKPPISKGKMAAITKAAMRAIKFYKHVVQSVEKFILKCKPEYKVPGLYVIDSIVRQSRHQFTIEKDVFAPRFARNMKDTFINLFHCPVDDRSRIIRVLNLWQKNNVFQPAVIQPLFDMASELSKLDYQMPSVSLGDISSTSNGLNTSSGQESSTSMGCGGPGGPDENTVAELSIGHHHDQSKLRHLQHIQHLILRQSANESSSTSTGVKLSESVKINKRVLDYDYGDEEDEETIASPNVSNLPDGNNLTQLLKDPNVLRQLQTLQNFQKMKQAQEEKQLKLNEMRLQEEAFEKHLQNVLKGGNSSQQDNSDLASKEVEFISEENKIEVINLDGNDSRSPTPDKDRYKRRRSRSRSRSRDRSGRDRDRRRRSRSRSRSRSPRSSRRRSSRERERERGGGGSDRNREKDREYERERRRKGLPDLKKNHLSVCSTTLWVGHLSKLVHQEELSDTFGKYGEIVSIDMIVPRGCAFIVMHRRQDAYKAMNALKNHKLQSRTITISWAAGKGVKSKEWKDFWDLDLGVTYIPWDKLDKDTDLEFLEDGGMFDEDTLPSWVKEKISQDKTNKDKPPATNVFPPIEVPGIDTSQPPPTGTMMTGVQLVPPQFQIGGVPRLMSGPMGVPLQGIPMPNMVPGMPPHHMMLPPGYPPMPVDKSVPPPNNGGNRPDSVTPNGMGLPPGHFIGMPPLHLGMPPQFGQPPVGFNMPPQSSAPSNDDQMDIEMEVETSPLSIPTKPPPGPPPLNFNQPPPLFPNFPSDLSSGESRRSNAGEEFNVGNRNNRDNRNDRERSRWGGRNDREDSRDRNIRDGPSDVNISGGGNGGDMPWRENSNNFQNNMFVENSRRGGPGNIPPLDLNAPIPGGLGHRAGEFFGRNEDFNDDHRGGPRDFFPNMGNRFGPPGGGNGSIQMAIGPPQFGSRMVGPMFIRGGGGGQGGSGNFNFNENPFDRERDDRGGNRIRGGACDRRGGRGNWRDDDDGLFNRRGNGGRFNNRDRDGLAGGDERRSRDRDRDRNRDRDRGGRDRTSRDRNSRDLQHRNSRNKSVSQTRDDDKSNPTQSPKQSQTPTKTTNNTKNMSPVVDTEEDWDQMLPEHNIDDRQIANERDETSPMLSQLDFQNNLRQENTGTQLAGESNFVAPPPPQRVDQGHFSNTPLYDEPVEAGNPGNITLDSANSDNDNSFTNNNKQQSHSMQEYIDTQHSAQSAEYGNNSPSTSFFEHEEENICSQTDEMPNEE